MCRSYAGGVNDTGPGYNLDDQIGYLLRKATQRHLAIFSAAIPALTTTQFAALARLHEMGPLSQNQLGRATAMDAATIKGVVGRLYRQGLVATMADPGDRRRLTVALTDQGRRVVAESLGKALEVSARTLEPLDAAERANFMVLLSRLV